MEKLIFALLLVLLFLTKLNAQTIIKMQNEGGVYTMPCEVNGLKLRFIFDTGASNVSISLSEAAFMLKNGYLDEDDLHGSSYSQIANGDIVENTTVNIKEIEIAGIKLYNVEAIIIHELNAPLLLGNSAISKLGKIQIDGDELVIVNAKEPSSQQINSSTKISDTIQDYCTFIDYESSYWHPLHYSEEQMQILRKCAELGNIEAQSELGHVLYYKNIFNNESEEELKEAYHWIIVSAEQGNPEAQDQLGSMFDMGKGVTKDKDQALYWYQKSAENGNSGGQFHLGNAYKHGDGLPQDYEKAIHWYKKASAQEESGAEHSLGNMYFYGKGVPVNYKEAMHWLEKAQPYITTDTIIINYIIGKAKEGLSEAQYLLGKKNLYADNTQAIYWLRKAADQGYRKAQSKLGELYSEGEEVSKDYKQAEYWHLKAAEQGDVSAQFYLGYIYSDNKVKVTTPTRINDSSGGVKIPINFEKACYWYKKAIDQGDQTAQYNLARMYYNGEGVIQDYEQAFQLYRKAAEQGYLDAQFMLGLMYDLGQGTNKDSQQAINWHKKAAVNGDIDAQRNLGYIFNEHQDYKQAFFWFEKAAKKEDASSQLILGNLYSAGEGILKDYNQAAFWYKKAAEQKNETAQYFLGLMYLHGVGVSIDKKEAAYWIKKSYENGDKDAKDIWEEYELWQYLN